MRILHLDAGREMRGGQWQVLRLVRGLAAEGVESTLLARQGAPLYRAAALAGLRVEPLSVFRTLKLAAHHDLIHAHDARSHTVAMLAPAPLVVSRRVAFPIGSPWKYARPQRYLAVSEFVQRVLLQGGIPQEKIEVVYDGVPLLEPAQGVAILAPAALSDPEKGTGLAVKAAQQAGVELELSTDLEKDLPRTRLLIYITYNEGLGSAVLLAMSAGIPVIASKVGGLPEIIRSGENGILVENRVEAIAHAMSTVLDNPSFAQRLGLAGRQTVARQFTVEDMVRRTLEAYRQVLRS
jgi:hypothetical protein